MNKIKLANVPVGKSINAFGKKFTVLDHTDEGTLVLSDVIERNMPFHDKCNAAVAPNDFRDSNICGYLNGEYFAELTNNGVYRTNAILDMSIDLKDTFGQREYGFFKTKVGLLTLEQYGKYYDIIPKIGACWWLATPYGSPNTYNACYVWYVSTDGNYYDSNYSYSCGVRPALILDSSLLISCDDVPNSTTSLSDYSNEELLEEIKRRVFEAKAGEKLKSILSPARFVEIKLDCSKATEGSTLFSALSAALAIWL